MRNPRRFHTSFSCILHAVFVCFQEVSFGFIWTYFERRTYRTRHEALTCYGLCSRALSCYGWLLQLRHFLHHHLSSEWVCYPLSLDPYYWRVHRCFDLLVSCY